MVTSICPRTQESHLSPSTPNLGDWSRQFLDARKSMVIQWLKTQLLWTQHHNFISKSQLDTSVTRRVSFTLLLLWKWVQCQKAQNKTPGLKWSHSPSKKKKKELGPKNGAGCHSWHLPSQNKSTRAELLSAVPNRGFLESQLWKSGQAAEVRLNASLLQGTRSRNILFYRKKKKTPRTWQDVEGRRIRAFLKEGGKEFPCPRPSLHP